MPELASCQDPKKRYTKYQCIGRGASKVVYKAFDEVEGIEVAWAEVLNLNCSLNGSSNIGKERSKMLGEITMLRQLKHRNIMRLYDWWYDTQQQTLVFITELLTDGSLRRFLRRKHATGITLSVLKRYAWQILQALVYLHGHDPPIIHRDLKCDNIFVNGASGELKLGDLGFACLLRGMSAPLSVIGTPEFMAPELYDEHYDEKVDIYSYGMCLLELATMQYPYAECTNPAQIYRKVSQGIPPAGLAQVELPQLREFISLCISHDPGRRPEARQLLNHSFFEDLRAQIKAKGWLRAPAALPAAAAGVLSPGAAAAAAAADGRAPLSAPDGLAALAAAAAAAADAAGSEPMAIAGAVNDAGAAAAAGGSGCSADVAMARSMPEVAMLHATLLAEEQEQELQELQELQQQQQEQLPPQTAAQHPQQELQQQQQRHQQQPAQQHTIQRQEQQQQPQQPSQQENFPFEQQTQQQQQQQQQHSHWAPPDTVGTAATAMAAAASSLRRPGSGDTSFFTPNQSPFTSASYGSNASSCGSWGGGSSTTAGASSSVGVPARAGAKAAGAEGGAGCGPQASSLGRGASLGEEMSEEDVLFDAHSSEGHSDEADQHSDHSDSDSSSAWHLAGGGHHRQQQQQQQQQQAGGGAAAAQAKAAALAAGCGGCCLDPIAEDGADDEEDETTVDCVCRRIDQQQLSFNVGFFNTKGMRKRVGFQYNAAEDTADDIAVEMLENLSLMPDQAAMIAEKIKAALAALGIGPGGPAVNGTTQPPAAAAAAAAGASPSAAAAGSSGGGGNGAVTGESAAIAIVATAAASAALESVGTPAGTDPGSSAVSGGGASAASSYGGGSGSGPGAATSTPQGLDLMGLAAAAGCGGGPDATPTTSTTSPGGGGVHPQQLVRQLSLLRRDQGEALLHSLQDDLLAQSLAMPQAAAAVGVDIAELAAAGGASPRAAMLPVRSAPLPALEPLLEGQQLQLMAGGAGGEAAAGAAGANWTTP